MSFIYIPRESTALSRHAGEVVLALQQAAAERDLDLSIIRNGSRGAAWLEPLIEVESDAGRIAYGPVSTADVDSLLDADFLNAGEPDVYKDN